MIVSGIEQRNRHSKRWKEILDLARNEKKTLTYQDVMNKLSDLELMRTRLTRCLKRWNLKGSTSLTRRRTRPPCCPPIDGHGHGHLRSEGISIDDPVRMYLRKSARCRC